MKHVLKPQTQPSNFKPLTLCGRTSKNEDLPFIKAKSLKIDDVSNAEKQELCVECMMNTALYE